jgi:osmoprotectant transport system ATP-binding protein
VLDGDGGLAGWVGRDIAGKDGVVRDLARRMNAWVQLDDSLRVAFGEMLQWNAGWIAVLDKQHRYLGVLTPSTLHGALRRSVEADAQRVEPELVELETVQDV